MLKATSILGHGIVGLSVVAMGVLGTIGVIGAGEQGLLRPEHFDAKQVTVSPAGGEGIRVREVVDMDFGLTERHGYERTIWNDFGVPTEITASSPDANSEIDVDDYTYDTRIRLGSSFETYTGQRRYVLSYTLPEAQLSSGTLAVDIIGTDETFTTDRFEVVVVGFELSDTRCDVGGYGDFGGCELVETGPAEYRVVFDPLEPGEGITIGGTIESIDEAAALPDIPAAPSRNTRFHPLGFVLLAVGAVVAIAVYLRARHVGSNLVYGAGGAADAAFGSLPVPEAGQPVADVPTYRVPDSRLAELATIEFVPPRGIEPWQGNVLLRERVDDDTVSAWFSEMVARGAIVMEGSDDKPELVPGENWAQFSAVDQQHLGELFRYTKRIKLGKYYKSFQTAWRSIASEQKRQINDAGWWQRPIAGGGLGWSRIWPVLFAVGLVLVVGLQALAAAAGDAIVVVLGSWYNAVLLTVLVVGVVSFLAYRRMLPARTAQGSALTLRTESFRRFLDASEAKHVEWAWKNGLLREYSAWAVALGEAEAWKRAIEASNVPEPVTTYNSPLLVYSASRSFSSARTPPSSSGSGGGGGFSGGGVGGGGGGGSSGSW